MKFTAALSVAMLFLATLMAAPRPVVGQGMVSDGALTLRLAADPTVAGSADLEWMGVDQLDQVWFWYRLAGDGFETRLPLPDSQSYVGNQAQMVWGNVDGRGFDLVMNFDVSDCTVTLGGTSPCMYGGPWGALGLAFEITNLTASAIDLQLFFFLDPQVAATAVNDRVIFRVDPWVGDNVVGAFEGSTTFSLVQSVPYAVSTPGALRALLDDGTVDNLSSTGLPFGPGDAAIASQGSINIAASDTVQGHQTVLVDWPLFVSTFEGGGTGEWSSVSP